MKIYYREKSGGIEILRCFGIEGRVEIPGMIDGKLGDQCGNRMHFPVIWMRKKN